MAEPLCDARASRCRCAKTVGHVEAGDEVHACHPDVCTGQWIGDFFAKDDSFRIVSLAFPVGEPRPWPDELDAIGDFQGDAPDWEVRP